MTHWIRYITVALVVVVVGCSSDGETGQAFVRAAHFAPEIPAVDICVDGSARIANLAYGNASRILADGGTSPSQVKRPSMCSNPGPRASHCSRKGRPRTASSSATCGLAFRKAVSSAAIAPLIASIRASGGCPSSRDCIASCPSAARRLAASAAQRVRASTVAPIGDSTELIWSSTSSACP